MIYIDELSNAEYRFEIYINYEHLPIERIKQNKGCNKLINLGYFDMNAYLNAKTNAQVDKSAACDLVVSGKPITPLQWKEFGVAIDKSGNLYFGTADNATDYCVGLPPQYIGGKKYMLNTFVAKNGCTHIGFKADGTIVWALALKDNPSTNDEVNAELLKRGCINILRYDGSWSGQGIFADGVHKPSQERIVQSLLLAYKRNGTEKKEDKTMKVCLDPGHGTGEMNQSPDGKYLEHEFALDMANRIRTHLVRCGVDVKLTREDSSTPSLTARATTANNYGADLFVSLHSNAVSGGWNDKTHGLSVWTYAMGGERDRAARLLLDEVKAVGVETFGYELYHNTFVVLKYTNMPAYLIEYAFHTCHSDVELLKSDAHRNKLAEATAKAIVAWGGVKWVDKPSNANKAMYRVIAQIGAYTDKPKAEAAKKEMESKGYVVTIEEVKG